MSVNDALCTLLVVAGQQVDDDSAAVLDLLVAAGQEELKDLSPVLHLYGEEEEVQEDQRRCKESTDELLQKNSYAM